MAFTIIKTNEINGVKIKEILDKYLIESELDDDGDVVIDEPIRIYMQANEKEKIIRIFRFSYLFGLFDDVSTDLDESVANDDLKIKLYTAINEANAMNYFAKHSIFKKSILSEMTLMIDPSLSEEIIVRYFKKFQSEVIKLNNSTPFKEWL